MIYITRIKRWKRWVQPFNLELHHRLLQFARNMDEFCFVYAPKWCIINYVACPDGVPNYIGLLVSFVEGHGFPFQLLLWSFPFLNKKICVISPLLLQCLVNSYQTFKIWLFQFLTFTFISIYISSFLHYIVP